LATDPHDRGSSKEPFPEDRGVAFRQLSLALELPVVLVASTLIGGGLGYLLDHWLHRLVVFTLLGGGLGFAAGITDVIRRLRGEEKRDKPSEGGGGSRGAA
jgi:F0F1-type ATP synthase assembly protein I